MNRSEQNINDTWNLEAIFKDEQAYNKSEKYALSISRKIKALKGKLNNKESVLELLRLNDELGITLEKLGSYAYMRTSEDGGDSKNTALMSTFIALSSKIDEETSFVLSQLLENDTASLTEWKASPQFKDYKVYLTRLIRQKEHILSEKEERILSLQSDVGGTFSRAFDDLTDVDFDFGEIDGVKLTHSSYSAFLQKNDIELRKKAYYQYYKKYDECKHAISKMYEGAVRQGIFTSKARGYKSVLDRALFKDNISKSVFLNLIEAAHSGCGILERFYALKKRALGLDKLSHFDVYTPLEKTFKKSTSYDEAVELVISALAPLGKEYTDILKKGLTTERWVDRYENKGKASGAYSNGSYKTLPYIMMSYKNDVLRDVFTLAHEGGHSMHSYYSARNNPYSCYSYTIFEAEVASTFNEMMLFKYLLSKSESEEERKFLLTKEADDIVATFFRQTMFAEYEYKVHERAEKGEPITLDIFLAIYKELLEQYLPGVYKDETASLECLRIPHFYRPFYVWKYATGISAAACLSHRVYTGGEDERKAYLGFLKSGGSQFPLDSLKKAGADLRTIVPFTNIVKLFDEIVTELEKLY